MRSELERKIDALRKQNDEFQATLKEQTQVNLDFECVVVQKLI